MFKCIFFQLLRYTTDLLIAFLNATIYFIFSKLFQNLEGFRFRFSSDFEIFPSSNLGAICDHL